MAKLSLAPFLLLLLALSFDSSFAATQSDEKSTNNIYVPSGEEQSEDLFGDIEMATDDPEALFVSESDESSQVGIPVKSVVTQEFFNGIISEADPSCAGKKFYTRGSFLNATKSYPMFGKLGNDTASKREIAAFFAHVTYETGHLCYIEEIWKGTFCDASSKQWPCTPGKRYYGRGPLFLTWNFNYGPCGKANNFDGLKNPGIVARDPVVAWKASIWAWMKNVHPVVGRGFGATIRALTGALVCDGRNPAAVTARVEYYESYCKSFKVSPGPNLRC
ncbi:Chitinase 4 [Linum grandiflorum]